MKPVIRPVRKEDAPAILGIYTPYILDTPVTFEVTVPSVKEMASRIEMIARQYPYWVCEIDGKVAGYAYASVHRTRSAYRWSCESSVYIDPQFHRMKIGKALYVCLTECLRFQGVKTVLAGITLPNPESVGFHENFGFTKAAEFHDTGYKMGKWYSVGWWELDLNPGMGTPRPQIIPFPEIPANFLDEVLRMGIEVISL